MVAGVSTYLAAFRSPATARASVGDLVPGWGTISFLVPRLEQPQGIAVAPDGTVYLTDTKLDRVLHFSPSGRLLGSWGGKGRGFGQLRDPQAIAVDATGTVYVADTGNDRIQIFTEDGHFVRAWGRVGNGKREFRGPDGIAVDDQGDVIVSDYANNRVADFTSQGQWVHDVLNPLGPNGPISPGQLALDSAGRLYVANSYGDVLVANPSLDEQQNAPLAENGATSQGVAVDASGHLFVASAGLPSQVEEFSASGRLLRRWGPGGSTSAEFGSLGALALSPDGSSLYTVDTTRRRVELYSLRGQFQGGWGPAAGPTPPQQPDAVAVAPNGDVLVADTGNNRIVKMSRSGALLATWGSTGSRPGQFVLPRGLAVDMKGNTYVADQGNNRVQKLDPNGRVIAVWGARPLGSGVEPAALPSPRGVAIDPRGRILVLTGPSDAACCGGVIHVFTPAGRQVAVWPNLASGANSQPLGPSAIAIDRQGNVYVGDAFTGAVWVLDRHGVPVRQWPGSGLGQPSAVRGLTAGPGGNVYAVDTLHDRIDVFSPTGTLLASAGGTGSQSGQFMGPSGIAVDGQDNVYVADTGNDRVQKFAHVH
jgi:sugar lactone lactonase YvrE